MNSVNLLLAKLICTLVADSKKKQKVCSSQEDLWWKFQPLNLHNRRLIHGSYSTHSTVSRMMESTALSYIPRCNKSHGSLRDVGEDSP